MSGGGKAPSAPNLSGNTANANNTFNSATSNAAQVMNTAQGYNTNAQNNLSNVTNTTNSMAGQIGATANQNLQTYGSSFVPLQSTEANAAQAYGSNANIARLQGQAISDVNGANQAARNNAAQSLAAEGVDPASIHGGALDRQAAVTGAGQAAQAGTQSAINTQQQAFNMENTANNLGTQVGALGTSGAATGAQVAQAGQQGINTTNASGVQNLTAGNTYLNTGVNANNSAVNTQQAQFGDQMQQYNANQANQAGIGSLVGDVAGAAMMFMEEGGPVPARQGIPTATNYSAGGNVTENGAMPSSPIPGSTDRKPALLTPGEFVMPKDVVDFKGQDYFHRQIDSIRQAKNKRMAIPVNHMPHVSAHA